MTNMSTNQIKAPRTKAAAANDQADLDRAIDARVQGFKKR
jgi:hypothetical protein